MSADRPTARERTERWLAAHPEIGHVTAAVADINGNLRGKRLPRADIEKALDGGLRMPLSTLGVDIWGADVLGSAQVFETGDADGVLEPTERGLLPPPVSEPAGALLPLWTTTEDGRPYDGDPRRALAAIVQRFADMGLTPVVATELEFYLVDASDGCPCPPHLPGSPRRMAFNEVLSAAELEAFAPFMDDLYAACALQDVPAAAAIAENGCGQFEINLHHAAYPLKAADDALLFKRLTKTIARRHGLAATFMAKPYGDQSGSSLHVHFSLLDRDGRNLFDDGGDAGSPTLRHAVGGLLHAMSPSTLLFAPHQNSYRRLRKGTHAPVAEAWGYENRTTALRIPGGAATARRIEHRVAGADANPYLVLAAILGAALTGIEGQIEPPAPIQGDAYGAALPPLPPDWASAIVAFAESALMDDILNPTLKRMLAAAKRQELERFAADVSAFEYRSYLDAV